MTIEQMVIAVLVATQVILVGVCWHLYKTIKERSFALLHSIKWMADEYGEMFQNHVDKDHRTLRCNLHFRGAVDQHVRADSETSVQ